MDGRLVDRVHDLVREHTRRETADHLLDLDEHQRGISSSGGGRTLCSLAAQRTLSLMRQLSRRKVSLYFMFLNSPPTSAARWITCVGWYFSKMASVAGRSLRRSA